jgi:succinate dehydrogenase / fumarate reductase iron-sulfur subunit
MGHSHDTNEAHGNMKLHLKIWRQKDAKSDGRLVDYTLDSVSPDMSFLEMLDILNQKLIKSGDEPVVFDHDCREGICGSCSLVINGEAHGPQKGTTACQLHMRTFKNGDTIFVEPWRARAFPIIKDLMVDRTAFDRVIAAGGFVNFNTGNPVDANAVLIPKENADLSFDAAACIGCGACVAACKNASAMLFVSAKISHLDLLPQGNVESSARALNMVRQMDAEGFGNCSMTEACEAACPKEISVENIVRMNRLYLKSTLTSRPPKDTVGGDA